VLRVADSGQVDGFNLFDRQARLRNRPLFSQAYLPTSVDPQENPRQPARLVCRCIAPSRLRRAVLASAK
jgi:hypothetical protein